MTDMARIFIGYDRTERAAYHVLAESIIRHSSIPVSITPVGSSVLPARLWSRPRGPKDSTEFSNARFMVPALAGYRGWAIFMDCDMVCLGDIAELWAQREEAFTLKVVQHKHEPQETEKFLGQPQTRYERKNWSSLMLMNCAHPGMRALTPTYVNSAPGLDLHRFSWLPDPGVIAPIRGLWNVLCGMRTIEHPEIAPGTNQVDLLFGAEPKLLHFTDGGVWHGRVPACSTVWMQVLASIFKDDNPAASVDRQVGARLYCNVEWREPKPEVEE